MASLSQTPRFFFFRSKRDKEVLSARDPPPTKVLAAPDVWRMRRLQTGSLPPSSQTRLSLSLAITSLFAAIRVSLASPSALSFTPRVWQRLRRARLKHAHRRRAGNVNNEAAGAAPRILRGPVRLFLVGPSPWDLLSLLSNPFEA